MTSTVGISAGKPQISNRLVDGTRNITLNGEQIAAVLSPDQARGMLGYAATNRYVVWAGDDTLIDAPSLSVALIVAMRHHVRLSANSKEAA